jgi:hypothetical protein
MNAVPANAGRFRLNSNANGIVSDATIVKRPKALM